jgi:hypothetical protein
MDQDIDYFLFNNILTKLKLYDVNNNIKKNILQLCSDVDIDHTDIDIIVEIIISRFNLKKIKQDIVKKNIKINDSVDDNIVENFRTEIYKDNMNENVNLQDLLTNISDESKRILFLPSHFNLNSFNSIRFDSNNQTIFKWDIANLDNNSNYNAVSSNKIKNIRAIRLLPFIFPSTKNGITNNSRIYVEIIELNNQAFIGYNNKRFHFEFAINYLPTKTLKQTGFRDNVVYIDDNSVDTKYNQFNCSDLGKNIALFKFTKPISEINSISIRFSTQVGNLILDQHIVTGKLITTSTLIQKKSTLINSTGIIFDQEPYINIYDQIIINKITSDNYQQFPNIQNMINKSFYINYIYKDTSIGKNIYIIPFDSTFILNQDNNAILNIILMSKKINLNLIIYHDGYI